MSPRDNNNIIQQPLFEEEDYVNEEENGIIFQFNTSPDAITENNIIHFTNLMPVFIEISVFMTQNPNANRSTFDQSHEIQEICLFLFNYIFHSGLTYEEKTFVLNTLIDSYPETSNSFRFTRYFFSQETIHDVIAFGLSDVFIRLINSNIFSVNNTNIGTLEMYLETLNLNRELFSRDYNYADILIYLTIPN